MSPVEDWRWIRVWSNRLKHRDVSEKIIGVFFQVYNALGHGFLEAVYERAFAIALVEKGLCVRTQIEVPPWFRGHKVGDFSADMLVQDCISLNLNPAAVLMFPIRLSC